MLVSTGRFAQNYRAAVSFSAVNCRPKGVIKTIRSKYPDANISPVDYDPGASEANQANRIKLLMTVAKDNLKTKNNAKKALEKENITSTDNNSKKEEIRNVH